MTTAANLGGEIMNVLINTYHNTEYRTKLTNQQLSDLEYRLHTGQLTTSERRTIQRIKKRLCGIDGCCCGDTFGRCTDR